MVAQYMRIATAFRYLEVEVLLKMEFLDLDDPEGKRKRPFQSISLKDKWLGFTKANFADRITYTKK